MAERSPPLPGKNVPKQFPPPVPPTPTSQQLIISHPTQASSTATFRSGTYIVQVPKDQIHRMPPPENAFIFERHCDPAFNKKKPLCCSFCCLGIIAGIVLIIIALVAIILIMFAKSSGPTFTVERFVVNDKKTRPDYNVTLKALNPNSRVAIVFKEGASATLNFKQKTIANAKVPSLFQVNGKSREVVVVLHGSNVVLPKEIEKSLGTSKHGSTSKVHVSLSMEMDIPARLRIGTLNSRSIKFHVTCDIMVDTLAKGTRVLKQECQTKRR